MNTEDLIKTAELTLPNAFSRRPPKHIDSPRIADITSAVPWRVGPTDPLAVGGVEEVPPDELPESADQLSPQDLEDAEELEASQRELGFEVLAFYSSFHYAPALKKWGIFYYAEGIRRLTVQLMRRAGLNRPEAERIAWAVLRAHERYHFRFDVGALHEELVLRQPLYLPYAGQVYAATLYSADCVEESLANRALMRINLWSAGEKQACVRQFMHDFCKSGPPGYQDFDRNIAELKQRLVGQLRTCNRTALWPGPETEWLAHSTRQVCPEYIIRRPRFPRGTFLTIKSPRHIWIIHRNDADTWPSSPHAHDYEHNQKLDLGSGEIYDASNKKCIGNLGRKRLLELREDILSKWPAAKLPTSSES